MAFDFDRAVASQKALAAHPALMDRSNPVSLYSPGKAREDAVISHKSAGRHLQAYGGGEAIDWVYDAIGLYADAAGTAQYRLEKEDGTKLVRTKNENTPPEYELGPKELYALLDKPNPHMLYDELLALLVIDLLLVGNGYWFKWRTNDAGRPLALYRLSPTYVNIVPGAQGPKRYEYQPPGVKNKLKIDPDELLHFRRPNPHDAYYGMGVIQGSGRSMDLELALTETMTAYYANRADPSMIVESDRRVPRDVFNKLRAQLRARTAGPNRAGELLVLESGLKATSLSVSAADALFDKLAKMSRDRVLTKFRTSPMLFGLNEDSGGANKVSDVRREFDNATLRPFLWKLSNQISAGLASAYGARFVIDHRSYLPAEDAIKVGDSIAKMPGVKIREIRKQYEQFGIEESTGDPEIDNKIINVPTEELDENGQNVFGEAGPADQPIGDEAGRPPKIENTVAFGTAKAAKVETKALTDALAALEAKAFEAPARTTVGNRLPDEKRPDDPYAAARKADVTAASRFIEDGLRDAAHNLERSLLDHVEGKALKTSDLVQRVKSSEAWRTFRSAIIEVLEEGARRGAASGVVQSGLSPDEEVDYDDIAKSVVHRPDGVRSILKTLRDRVVARVKDERNANAERDELNAAVRAVMGDWTQNQASLIAETEAVHAYNEATLTAAELSGVTTVFVTDGDGHDEPCQEANGMVWDIAQARENRLEHPRCRRAFLPLTAA